MTTASDEAMCIPPTCSVRALELEAAGCHPTTQRGLLLPLPLEVAPFSSWNLTTNTELRQTEHRQPPADAFLLTAEH